jgi:hypothetical protein
MNTMTTVSRSKSKFFNNALRYICGFDQFSFNLWRSVWCSYVTYTAFKNVMRLNEVFKNNSELKRHTYYDAKTAIDLKILVMFFLTDLVVHRIRINLMSKSTVIHHYVGIALCLSVMFSKYTHHYHANMLMCSEVVSMMTVLSYFAKQRKSRFLRKIYLLQYLLLTVFGRGYIWFNVVREFRSSSNISYLCYAGLAPLVTMDAIWSRQCINGLLK